MNTKKHTPEVKVGDDSSDWGMIEFFRNGGHALRWNYWCGLESLTAKEACCLIYSLDADYYDKPNPTREFLTLGAGTRSLDRIRPEVEKLIRHAERQTLAGKLPKRQSAWQWVCWAKEQGIEVNPAFRAAALS
jgi:hypothetical protein